MKSVSVDIRELPNIIKAIPNGDFFKVVFFDRKHPKEVKEEIGQKGIYNPVGETGCFTYSENLSNGYFHFYTLEKDAIGKYIPIIHTAKIQKISRIEVGEVAYMFDTTHITDRELHNMTYNYKYESKHIF